MKVKELIKELSKFNPELEVTILDGFNGGGQPRQINLGPIHVKMPKEPFTFPVPISRREEFEYHDTADFEDTNSTEWITMGYGCY